MGPQVRDALINATWSYDAFQTPILMSTLALLRDPPLHLPKFHDGLQALLSLRPDRTDGPDQSYSAYVQYWTAHALWRILADPRGEQPALPRVRQGRPGDMRLTHVCFTP
jgi:hypothetical protein